MIVKTARARAEMWWVERPWGGQRADIVTMGGWGVVATMHARTERAGWPPTAPRLIEGVRVAVLADRPALREAIEAVVREQRWVATDIAADDLDRIQQADWDLVVLAGSDAPHLALLGARAARSSRRRVIIISDDHDPQHVADALNSGADDYLTVPFDRGEVAARMRSLIRQRDCQLGAPSAALRRDPAARTLGSDAGSLHFSPGEWRVLESLLDAAPEPIRCAELAAAVFGDASQCSRIVTVISRIRRRLDQQHFDAVRIETVRGDGYVIVFD